jgi:hypothetical protein
VCTEHHKRHQEQVEIRFSTGMLDDILENSIFPGEQIVKYYIKQRQNKCFFL